MEATLFGALLDFILYRKEMNSGFDFGKIDVRGFERVGHIYFSDDKIRVGKGLNEGYKDVILQIFRHSIPLSRNGQFSKIIRNVDRSTFNGRNI